MSSEKEEERKSGGALPPWMSSGARVGSMARGGSAAGRLGGLKGLLSGRVAALFGSKLGAAAVMALTLAVSGYGLLDMNKRGGFGVEAPKKALAAPSFRSSYSPDQTKEAAYSSSGLEMASKANKGLFDGGAPSADAPSPTGDASKDAAAGQEQTPQAPSVDAAALAQGAAEAAQGGGKALPNAGYGKFSSGMGGLAGGGGMAGGVGQSFQQPKLSNTQLAQAKAFNSASTGKVARGMTPARNLGRSALKGANARRLDDMNRAMGASRRGGTEAAAATHTQQWSNGAPTGSSIQGAGVGGTGTGGQFSGDEGVGDGSPVGTPTATPTTEPPAVDGGKNVTPYQSQVDMAVMLLLASSILTIIATSIWLLAKAGTITAPIWLKIAMYLSYAAAALAAMACLMGVMIMAQGQMGQGLIFTICGGLAAVLAWMAASNAPESAAADKTVGEMAKEASKTVILQAAGSAGSSALGGGAGAAMGDK